MRLAGGGASMAEGDVRLGEVVREEAVVVIEDSGSEDSEDYEMDFDTVKDRWVGRRKAPWHEVGPTT